LPAEVRAALEERLASPVVASITQPTGFSPGLAARLRLEDDRRVFIKAVSEAANPDSPSLHRREARIVAALPVSAPVPRLLWTYDEGGWVALCFEDVDGRHPYEPWTEPDLALVVDELRDMGTVLTPSPFEVDETAAEAFADHINGWQVAHRRGEARLDEWCVENLGRLAELEAEAPALAAGHSLVHFDLRADNLLLAGDRVYVVDWPWARLGPAWVDWVAMAPSVAMQGGPDPESFLSRFEIQDVTKQAIDAVICTMTGYFVVGALDPPPPGLPTVRAFQAAQGRVAVRWLRERTGWD
jgi:aminoglycoside phosphotransferase (APT) family kinase protein